MALTLYLYVQGVMVEADFRKGDIRLYGMPRTHAPQPIPLDVPSHHTSGPCLTQ